MKKLIIVICILTVLVGCDSKNKPASQSSTEVTSTNKEMTLEIGCAACLYKMEGVQGCSKAAVKMDGKAVMVTGAEVDIEGLGLCKKAKSAKIMGKVEGGKLVATKITVKK